MVPAPPPRLAVGLLANVFESTVVDPVAVELIRDTGSGDEVIATLPPIPEDESATIELPEAGDYRLRLLDAFGLEIAWSCDGVSSTTPVIGFTAVLGEIVGCSLLLSDALPSGSTTLSLTKDEDPDSFWEYEVTVELDGFVVASETLFDGADLVVNDLPEGEYTVTEAGMSEYELASVECSAGVSVSPILREVFDTGDGALRVGTFRLTVPADATVDCTLVNEPATAQPIVRVRTETVPAGLDQEFAYEITPSTSVVSGVANFTQRDADERSVGLEAFGWEDVVVTQSAVAGFDTTVECFPSAAGPSGDSSVTLQAFPPTFALGLDTTCLFVNTATAAPTSELTIRAVVDVGPITERTEFADLADRFDFDVTVTGDGVVDPDTATTRIVSDLADDATEAVDVAFGTTVTIDVDDALAGPDGFEYVIDCGPPGGTNTAVDITVTVDATCVITFRARTVTVNKFADPPPPSGRSFDFEVDAAVGGSIASFSLGDGDSETLVLPLGQATTVSEDSVPPVSAASDPWADTVFDCTALDATSGLPIGNPGPPFRTGPVGGDSITLPAGTTSYDCDVYNSNDEAIEITMVTDFGAVAVPSGFGTFDISVDGELRYDGDVVTFGQSLDLEAAESQFVFAYQDAQVTIDPGVRSESFETSISCEGFNVVVDGPITIDAVPDGGLTCVITNRAANVTVEKTTVGPIDAGDTWLFDVDGQLAVAGSLRLGAAASFTVAVPVDTDIVITELDPGVGVTVRHACGTPVPLGDVPSAPTLDGPDATIGALLTVSPTGATARSCVFENAASVPPTTAPPTTAPPTTAPPTTAPPATAPPTTAPPTTAPPTTVAPALVVPITPTAAAPIAPVSATTAPSVAPVVAVPSASAPATSTTSTSTPSTSTTSTSVVATTVPAAEPESDEPRPEAPEPVTVVPESGDDVFVELNQPFVIDSECTGELAVTINGISRSADAPIDPTALGIGDHVVDVTCDGVQEATFRAVVFDQEESDPSGTNMVVIVLFVIMAAGAVFFMPAGTRARRGVL